MVQQKIKSPGAIPFRRGLSLLILLAFLSLNYQKSQAQCSALASAVTIDFQTDQACAPVTVTQFNITYYFLVAQNPADIEIRYEWNDPANTVQVVSATPAAGNTQFSANATFTYNNNNGQCVIIPTAYVVINGAICTTSEQVQTAFFWGTDEQANGEVNINPDEYDVCFNNPVVNAVFTDNSEFNCNIMVEPDHPNRLERHVQLVYGTNHNPLATIRNLTLTDGGPQNLTNGSGNLASPQTRGTAGLPVTAGYFGPVDVVPFPADGPTSVSFPMNAPANVLNAVGNRFEITLFNWNVCNPWNGSVANPNYEDAEMTQAYIVIIDAPDPEFETRDNLGVATTDFCVNETIFFANLTPGVGSYNYTWTYYDDPAGTIVVGSSAATNPTFAYATGGVKLIRLQAENQSAQGACIEEITHSVNIAPMLNAQIGITDLSDVSITPHFCQNTGPPLNNFDVRFHDISTGTVTPNTRWRWEFFDENGVLILQEPTGGGFSSVELGPFDKVFTNVGIYTVRLVIQNNVTLCETTDEVEVRVYENPEPAFTATRVCEGSDTHFEESSTLNAINGESIILKEWDFDYDGITFNKDPAFDNQSSFDRSLGPGATYQIALRVTTNQNGCSDILIIPAVVDPMPFSSFTPDIISGCSILTVNFTNNAVLGQPDVIESFQWEVDENLGAGFQVIATEDPADPGFDPIFTRDFENITSADRIFDVRLRVITVNGCEVVSAVTTITVFPGTSAGFISTNYSPFNDNCSPVSVDFSVDSQTQSQNPSDYLWRVSDSSGVISEISTGTTPAYSHNFVNSTQSIKDFLISLIATLPTGCFGDSTRIIRVNPVPISDFIIDTLLFNCDEMDLEFRAQQQGLPSYHWTIIENGITVFDTDNSNSVISHTFNRPSSASSDLNVQAILQTTNFANCESAVNVQNVVVPRKDSFMASFTADPSTQTFPNSTVTITNNTSPGPWDYQWDFGDGTTSTDPGVGSHSYETFGEYVITLSVTNNVCVKVQTQMVEIVPIPPIVDFEYDPPNGCAPLTVQFINTSQYADPSTYVWQFGDGQATSNASDPSYTYYKPGKYTVSLSATNNSGVIVQEVKQEIIEVYPTPSALFEVRPTIVYVPGGTLYTNNMSFNATQFEWDFGDGANSIDFEPQHVYQKPGEYEIQLIAYNSFGCSDTTTLENGVKAVNGGQVLIPNAFSPGGGTSGNGMGDGRNDVFIPLTRGISNFHLLIFNRWGELLFESFDPQFGWNGYHKGKLCQQDVYVYKVTGNYATGEPFVRVGDVNLIR